VRFARRHNLPQPLFAARRRAALSGAYAGAVPQGDGDGWVFCRCGHRHWGRFGAAGLLLVRPGGGASPAAALLQHRSARVHDGGTWALPGGARDSHEDVVTAAVREAGEEAGIAAGTVDVVACTRGVDHGDWAYTYVVAMATPQVRPYPANFETEELAWVPVTAEASGAAGGRALHAGLAGDWGRLMRLVGHILA